MPSNDKKKILTNTPMPSSKNRTAKILDINNNTKSFGVDKNPKNSLKVSSEFLFSLGSSKFNSGKLNSNPRAKSRKSAIRTWEKKFRTQVEANELETAATSLRKTIACYDKAAKVGVVHQNKADRKKAQLSRVLSAATAS